MNGPVSVVTFSGNSGTGAISVPGVKVGDVIEKAIAIAGPPGTSLGSDFSGQLASFVVVDDEILQSSTTNWSALTIAALISKRGIL